MHNFVHGRDIASSISEALRGAEQMDLAVAFWGLGAIDRLGLSAQKPTRIICDALSGGCNPTELESLLRLSQESKQQFEVKHLSRIHSKVYRTPTVAFVSSANASANGLSEGNEGTIEAAIRTESSEVISQIDSWFEAKWDEAETIDEPLLQRARDAYKRAAPRPDEKTVLETLLSDPSWFRNRVRLIAIEGDASPRADAAYEEFGRRQFSQYELDQYDKIDFSPPYYENDAPVREVEKLLQAGDYALDFTDGSELVVSRLRPNPYIALDDKNSITLVEPRKDVLGRRFPAAEQKIFRKAVEQYLKETKIKRDDFGHYLDELPALLLDIIRSLSNSPKAK